MNSKKLPNSWWPEKYRPQTIEELVGNEEFMDKVKNWVETQEVPNLVLYSEKSGTGKTSACRLIAKLLDADVKYINASDENLRRLTDNWNAKHGPSRQIDRTHLIRLKSTIPQFSTSAEFWATVASQVAEEVKSPDAHSRNTPPDGGLDYDGYQTKALNAESIEEISQAELDAIKFDFREDDKQVQATKNHRSKFRDQQQQQQDSFNENSSKADNLRRGLDTAPTQGSASAGIHIYIVTNTYTHIHIVCTYTHTGQFSLTSIPSQTNTTFSSVIVSQFHLVNVHPTSSQPITNSHYLFHPRTTPDHY